MTPSPVTTTEGPRETVPWALERVQPYCPTCGSALPEGAGPARETAVMTVPCVGCGLEVRCVFWIWQGTR